MSGCVNHCGSCKPVRIGASPFHYNHNGPLKESAAKPSIYTLKKSGNWLPQQVMLGGTEQLFGLRQGHPEMLDAFVVLVEGDDISDSFFVTVIVAHDEL